MLAQGRRARRVSRLRFGPGRKLGHGYPGIDEACIRRRDAGLVLLGGGPADAAPPRTSEPVGIDVSWPQCGKTLPKKPAFAIVGVNNGLANTTNPCLAAQLAWAETAPTPPLTAQPRVALYVNTANPGRQGSWWPGSNHYAGVDVANPYGVCGSGADDFRACSYIYGYAKAYDDATIRGVDDPEKYLWWLDVETENSWQPDKAANVADLEGMAALLQEHQRESRDLFHRLPVGPDRRRGPVEQPARGPAQLARWCAVPDRCQVQLHLAGTHSRQPRRPDAVRLRRAGLQLFVPLSRSRHMGSATADAEISRGPASLSPVSACRDPART